MKNNHCKQISKRLRSRRSQAITATLSSEDGNAKFKRGLLTIVNKNTIECCQVNTPQTINGVETLAVAFTHSGKQHIIVNINVPGDALKREDDWERTITPLLSLDERVIITGDYNARSPSGLTVIITAMEVPLMMPILS